MMEEKMSKEKKEAEAIDIKSLKKIAITRVSIVFLILGLVLFLTAGTLKYWEAWVYMLAQFVPMMIFGVYMFKHNPKFLERRMRTKEKRKKQQLIQKVGGLSFLLTLVLPGLDKRLAWSDVPLAVTIAGMALVLFGYLMILRVFIANSYASRIVEVDEEQKVITTGPYALVRHPMYASLLVYYGASPLALSSYYALIPALSIILFLIARIKDEEKELLENLEGYREYTQKVKYRLIPGIW